MQAPWTPKVESRPHPIGEQGVRSSLEEVAKRVARGGSHPRVKEWAGELIHDARQRGISVKGNRARAEILLGAVQQLKTWVPDPVGVEYIKGAHLLACGKDDKHGPCFNTGDCDDMVVLLGSCFLSVGIHAMIVGHAYDAQRTIQHVITAARVNDKWLYADPSYDYPLGKCAPFTRERLLSVPNVKVICDESACLTEPGKFDPDKEGFVASGTFVGVDGIPENGREIWWIGMGSTIGQEPSAEEAAGQAAYDRAQKSAWPPTQEDYEAVGAAAGAAAGAVIGGPVGAAVGGVVGSLVGAAVFELGGAIAGGLDPRGTAEAFNALVARGRYMEQVVLPQVNLSISRLAALRKGQSISDQPLPREPFDPIWHEEALALVRYKLPITVNDSTNYAQPTGMTPVRTGPWYMQSQNDPAGWKRTVDKFSKDLFAAVAARTAEIQTIKAKEAPQKKGAVVPLVIGTAIVGGLAWWFLA